MHVTSKLDVGIPLEGAIYMHNAYVLSNNFLDINFDGEINTMTL